MALSDTSSSANESQVHGTSARTSGAGIRFLGILMDVALISTLIIFCYVHVHHVVVDHEITSLPFAIEQGVLAFITLVRRRGGRSSSRLGDWFVAAMGAWLPLLFRVEADGSAAAPLGLAIQLGGVSLATFCFVFLGRSFGVVAGNRGLKTRGPYRIVRHPVYAAHMITNTGFLIVNPTLFNLALWGVVVVFTVLRIRAEERFLCATSDYAGYQGRVRWRLVPGLF